ncbi:MAG: hypothetical protein AAF557_05030 [Pseudomonadota bacterium]
MTERPIRYFLLHVPKCSGNTIIRHFEQHLGDRAMHADPPDRSASGYPFTAEDLCDKDIQILHGHGMSNRLKALSPGYEVREAVMLRDTVGYFISMYNFIRQRHLDGIGPERPPFEAWYLSERKNPIARFLMQRYFGEGAPRIYRFSSAGKLRWLEERFADFWFVGSYRDVNMLTDRIAEDVGVPGAPERKNFDALKVVTKDSLDPAFVDRMRRDNAVDEALYHRWSDRGFRRDHSPGALPAHLGHTDQWRDILAEAELGVRKAWLRHVAGYNKRRW